MRVLVAVYGSVGGVFLRATAMFVCSKAELMKQQQIALGWAGIDVGKGHHWICLIDQSGTTVWSAKTVNDEAAILDAVGSVLARADEVVWRVDVTGTMSGLLLALLAAHCQRVRYVPGRTVNQMAGAYRGEAKTDARDADVIAETLRHRGDLAEVEVATSLVNELRPHTINRVYRARTSAAAPPLPVTTCLETFRQAKVRGSSRIMRRRHTVLRTSRESWGRPCA